MPSRKVIPIPELTPETARVFIASPYASVCSRAVESLEAVNLGHNIQVATNWREAISFVHRQMPGRLEANIFLFDGQLDHAETPGAARQGDKLKSGLLNTYIRSILKMTEEGRKQSMCDGLTSFEASQIFNYEVRRSLAAHRLATEALLVGMSDSEEGSLSCPAQIPRIPQPEAIGRIVSEKLELAIPQQIAA